LDRKLIDYFEANRGGVVPEFPEPDGLWSGHDDDRPGTETLEELGSWIDREFDRFEKELEDKRRKQQKTEYFVRKGLAIGFPIALVCVLAIIMFLVIDAMLPVIEKVVQVLQQP
jgi:hypothetical protein